MIEERSKLMAVDIHLVNISGLDDYDFNSSIYEKPYVCTGFFHEPLVAPTDICSPAFPDVPCP